MKYSFSYLHVLHLRPFPVSWYSSTLCSREARLAMNAGAQGALDDAEESSTTAIRDSMHCIRRSLAHVAQQVTPTTGSRQSTRKHTPRSAARSPAGARASSSSGAAEWKNSPPAVASLIRFCLRRAHLLGLSIIYLPLKLPVGSELICTKSTCSYACDGWGGAALSVFTFCVHVQTASQNAVIRG
jgi:hypothetical protein